MTTETRQKKRRRKKTKKRRTTAEAAQPLRHIVACQTPSSRDLRRPDGSVSLSRRAITEEARS